MWKGCFWRWRWRENANWVGRLFIVEVVGWVREEVDGFECGL